MKDVLKGTIVIFLTMLSVFIVANLLAYWYECYKDYCLWQDQTKNIVVWFTITFGTIGGFANVVHLAIVRDILEQNKKI